MAHVLIVGVTASGKSRLAKRLLSERLANQPDVRNIVLDILDDDWPGADVYTDWDGFHAALLDAHADGSSICAIIDEASCWLSVGDKQNHWLLTRGRHYGISCTIITQRPTQVAPSVRGMCTVLHAFALPPEAARTVADDFGVSHCASSIVAQDQGYWHYVRWCDGKKTVDKLNFNC